MSTLTNRILKALTGEATPTVADARAMADALRTVLIEGTSEELANILSRLVEAGVVVVQGDVNVARDDGLLITRSSVQITPERDIILEALQAFRLRIAEDEAIQVDIHLAEYLATMRGYCANLPYLTLHPIRSPRTLDQIYIPLKARPHPQKNKREAGDEGYVQKSSGSEPLLATEVLRLGQLQHVLVLGEPGMGKSTLLRQMAECAWDAPGKIGLDARHLPILVPLRRLACVDGSFEERLNQALTSELTLAQSLPERFFTEWPNHVGAHWLILLDALDEVPTDEHARLVQWLERVAGTVGRHRIVITSRPSGYLSGELNDQLFAHYDLLPFTPGQASEFAQKWFGDKADHFLQELDRVRFGELRNTPLLLTVAAKVYLENETLPQRRSELYGEFVDIWLSEANIHGLKDALGDRLSGPLGLQRARLAYLALCMTKYPSRSTPQELSEFLADFLRTRERFSQVHAKTYGRHFVETIVRRSGVFVDRQGIYDFIHPVLREYLAAQALVASCDGSIDELWNMTSEYVLDAAWSEVISMALAGFPEPVRFTNMLLARLDEDVFGSVLFAVGRLLKDIYQPTDVSQEHIVLRLQSQISAPYLMLAEDAFYVLSVLDDALALRSLSEALSTHEEFQTRQNCLAIVSKYGLAEVLTEQLFSIILDPSWSADNQATAIELLLGLRTCQVRERLFSLLSLSELRFGLTKKIVDDLCLDVVYQTRMLSLIKDPAVDITTRRSVANTLASVNVKSESLINQLIGCIRNEGLDHDLRIAIAVHVDPEGKYLIDPELLEELEYEVLCEAGYDERDEWDEYKAGKELRDTGYNADWIWAFASHNVCDLVYFVYERVRKGEFYYDYYDGRYGYSGLPFLDTLNAIRHYAKDSKTVYALWRLLELVQSERSQFPSEPVFRTLFEVALAAGVRVLRDGTIVDYKGNPISSDS